MKRLLLATFVAAIFNVSAQQLVNVKGIVVSADADKSLQVKKGEPLVGAIVKIKGTEKGKATDPDGNFELFSVPIGSILEINYSGFEIKELKVVNDTSLIKIKMKVNYSYIMGITYDYIPHTSVDLPIFFDLNSKDALIYLSRKNIPVPLDYFNTNSSNITFENFYKRSSQKPISSFAINVYDNSYNNSKTYLKDGNKPPKDLIRIEEFINSFSYQFPLPNNENNFSIHAEYSECPWNRGNKLLLVNVQSKYIFSADAKNANVKLEFNPSKVKYYRLVGYENRIGNFENFDGTLKDGNYLPNRHTITAIYEIEPAYKKFNFKIKVDSLRYQSNSTFDNSNELTNIKFSYTDPSNNQRKQIDKIVYNEPVDIEKASESMRFAVAVAEFAMLLKETAFLGAASYNQVIDLAESAKGTDENGERSEFTRYAKRLISSPYYGLK